MTRIAIADARATLRWALHEALGRVADFEVVGEAGSVDELLALVAARSPEVVVLDPLLPDHGTIDALAALRALEATPLIVMLASDTGDAATRALANGAHGWVTWSAPPAQLIEAIRAALRGERTAPPEIDALLAGGVGHRALTGREQQVMEMLGRGMTTREVAEHLAISAKTVDSHRGHILKKLGLRNNSDLTRYAVKHGYVGL